MNLLESLQQGGMRRVIVSYLEAAQTPVQRQINGSRTDPESDYAIDGYLTVELHGATLLVGIFSDPEKKYPKAILPMTAIAQIKTVPGFLYGKGIVAGPLGKGSSPITLEMLNDGES